MKLYPTTIICTLILLTASCIKKSELEDKTTNVTEVIKKPVIYNEAFNNNINLQDPSLGYIQILNNALLLDTEQLKKIKKITKEFRKKRSEVNEKQIVELKKERQQQINEVLTDGQILQKKFVDAIVFKIKVDKHDLSHPINIQKKLDITNGEMLKLLEIKSLYQKEKKAQLANNRIAKVIGIEKTKKCRRMNFLKQ